MAKQASKPQRWATALSELSDLCSQVDDKLTDLRDIAAEYEEWRDNMPESLQESATYDKLNELIDSADSWFDEIESSKDSIESAREELEAIDLPRGFGRD